MEPRESVLSELESRLRALSDAGSAAGAFAALLEGMRLAGPRGAVFLVKGGTLRGWRSFGYAADTHAALRSFACPVGAKSWLAGLAAAPGAGVRRIEGPGVGAAFGQPPAVEAAGTAVSVADRPVAVLLIERDAGDHPWHPAALGVLASVARLTLTLLVDGRRAAEISPPSGTPDAEGAATSTVAPPQREPAMQLAAPAAAPSSTDDERVRDLEAARRFARLVATDIRLYHEEDVVLGRRNGDLVERLSVPLGRGKETFLLRHAALGAEGLELLHEALVQVLAGGDASLFPGVTVD